MKADCMQRAGSSGGEMGLALAEESERGRADVGQGPMVGDADDQCDVGQGHGDRDWAGASLIRGPAINLAVGRLLLIEAGRHTTLLRPIWNKITNLAQFRLLQAGVKANRCSA